MTVPGSRRGFLRGLTTLPLIGGGVALIGNPTTVAGEAGDALMNAYDHWLFHERMLLHMERWPDEPRPWAAIVPANTGAEQFHYPGYGRESWRQVPVPSTRAALVLSTVGCGWHPEPPGKPPRRKFVIG